jgi:hypothetical protein
MAGDPFLPSGEVIFRENEGEFPWFFGIFTPVDLGSNIAILQRPIVE